MVIPALNEGALLERTVLALEATAPTGTEIVVVDDGSTDGCADFLRAHGGAVTCLRTGRRGAAPARNLGARHASGRILLFADAHVTPERANWWPPLRDALAEPTVGAVAPAISAEGRPSARGFGLGLAEVDLHTTWLPAMGTAPYAVPALPGGFLAMRRDVFDHTGGFDDGLRKFGFNDAELSLRLWLLGYELRVVPQVSIAHHFRARSPYRGDGVEFVHNQLRVARVHFSAARLARALDAARARPGFRAAMALADRSGDIEARRGALAHQRVRDDDWFFATFSALSTQRRAS